MLRAGMLSMAAGIGAVAFSPLLPPWWSLLLAAAPLAAAARRYRSLWWQCAIALLLGVGWGVAYGNHIRAGLLPAALEQQPLRVTGRVSGLVDSETGFGRKPVARFELDVERCEHAGADCSAQPRRIRLSWYETETPPHTGERWQLTVKLKRPRGFANPAGFDYEAWLVANRIGAVGYVDRGAGSVLLEAPPRGSIAVWRARVRDHLDRRLRELTHRDLLLGLLVGDGGAIPQSTWRTFRATGTVHILVVSGLQVAFTGGLALWLWRQFARTPLVVSTRRSIGLGVAPAVLVALVYALLAGFGLPLQRAMIMFAILAAALAGRRDIPVSSAWIFSLWLVLLCDPLAVRDIGFWFSFIAVASLLLALAGRRLADAEWWRPARWRWWRAQLAVLVATLPVLLALSAQFSWLALPANLLAVPLSTLVTMPLAFLALLADGLTPVLPNALADTLWRGADLSLTCLVEFLRWLETHGGALVWRIGGVDAAALAFAAAFALLALLPRGFPGRALALFLLLPLCWPPLDTPAAGAARVTVVDVGQGLAVLVETARHSLLFDTGPPFGPERNVAELTLTPLLRQRGIERLDTVVVSHRDSDHAAGWREIAREFAVGRLLAGEPLDGVEAEHCAAGERWRWDGVDFDMLYPQDAARSGNDASCVLQISAGGQRILLTGDIGRGAEARLLGNAELRQSTLLLAPHHGSRSSSTAAFVARVRPRYVVFSSGYLNRFRHPHPLVEQRYAEAGAQLFNTAVDGALIFEFDGAAAPRITRQRSLLAHYWD